VTPNCTSKLVAPGELQVSVGVRLTAVAPLDGLGDAGVDGNGGGAVVVNDQTGPVVAPTALRATTCQK
jgi:hypothetical protein